MFTKRIDIVTFALWATLCGLPAVCVSLLAQDQAPVERKQQDRDKNRTGQAQPRNHAAQGHSQQRQNHSAEERPRTGPRTESRKTEAAQGGGHRPAPNAHYQFRRQDAPRLRQHFQSQLAHVDRRNRPHVVAGAYLQGGWQTYIVPVPTEVITYLPPVPEGYQLAFYNGYIIVYDPLSGLVLDVIDLLEY